MTGSSGQEAQSSNSSGTSNKPRKKAQSSTAKVKHSKPADVMNITNGIQRLQLGKKGQHQTQKTPPAHPDSAEMEMGHFQYQSMHAQTQKLTHLDPHQKPLSKKGGGARKGSDVFSKSELYAGAGFDVSPAASSLPIPKFGKTAEKQTPLHCTAGSTTMRPISVEELLHSGQALSAPLPPHPRRPHSPALGPPQSPLGAGLSEAEQLRIKSEYLMKVFTARPETSPTAHPQRQQPHRHSLPPNPPPNTEQLEEMTAQVRRMLNI